MKEHDKALVTYQKGLEHDPDNQELKEGLQACTRAISRLVHGKACMPYLISRSVLQEIRSWVKHVGIAPV
jgi:hypothetical protein